jgi:hypothetical protein
MEAIKSDAAKSSEGGHGSDLCVDPIMSAADFVRSADLVSEAKPDEPAVNGLSAVVKREADSDEFAISTNNLSLVRSGQQRLELRQDDGQPDRPMKREAPSEPNPAKPSRKESSADSGRHDKSHRHDKSSRCRFCTSINLYPLPVKFMYLYLYNSP